MNGRVFVDTNILLYARELSEPIKQPVAELCLAELWRTRTGCVSVQVLNEYFVNATRKLDPGLSRAEAWEDVEALMAWDPIPIDTPLISRGFVLLERHGISYWDALIVAAAEVGGCTEILSEDLAHDALYAGIRVRNPFRDVA